MANIALCFLLSTLLMLSAKWSYAANEEEFRESKFLAAAAKNDLIGMQNAVKIGESVDTQNVNGWNGAMFAVSSGDMRATDALIKMGINLNAQTTTGMTSLMMAASIGDKDMVEMLLAGNASPLIKTAQDETAYDFAIASERKVVALLIAEAAVLHALESSQFDVMLEYIKHGAFVNIRNGAGYTPVIAAAASGNLEVVKELIALHADLNRVENDGWSPLHFAAVQGNEKMIEAMLSANAAPAIQAVDGKTPKMVAEVNNQKKAAKLLADAEERIAK